jgi:hypothetical protein
MEPSDLEKQLNELEEKIDRLRALYEQYFMGIERLEPLTPRKDVDRRFVILRKEQFRNTALRFRFNTLSQRFNTMQQHWGRITREIENGTYKRDVARAAARFGVDEAMTAVGRKRAASLQKVLERQGHGDEAERRKQEEERRKQAVADDDDAPTPPPPPGGLRPVQQPRVDASKFAPPPSDESVLANYGFKPAPGYATPGASSPEADLAALGFPSPPAAAQQPAAVQRARPRTDQSAPGISPPTPPPREATGQPVAQPAGGTAPDTDPNAPKKAAGGLRLGGGRRTADPDAARRRLQELAEKMGATPAAPPVTSEPRERRFNPDDVISAAIPASVPPPAPQRPAAAPAIRPLAGPAPVVASSPSAPERSAPPASKPLGLRPPTAGRASSPSLEGEAPPLPRPPPPPAPAAAPPPAASGPTAAERAEALRENAANKAAKRDEGLGESRVRQIYNDLIEAKRKANESTASITFDKLNDSLKKQVDKLKKEHTDRRIDFTVVTKDGKAMIKPIIK